MRKLAGSLVVACTVAGLCACGQAGIAPMADRTPLALAGSATPDGAAIER
jgi:hypothetical protein